MTKKLEVNTRPQRAIDGGKLQPQATDLEEAVLGAMMLEKNAVNEAIEILKTESFYKEAHQRIFSAILRLFTNSEPVDILTVTNELRSAGELDLCGGPFYVSQLTNKVASAANIQFHARIIAQKYIARELISVGTEMIQGAFDDTTDIFDLLNQAEAAIFKVSEGNTKKDFTQFKAVLTEVVHKIELAGKTPNFLSGIPSGFRDVDKITGGWQKQDLIIIAGRPSMGKSGMVFSMCRNMAAEYNIPVAIFSLEMSAEQVVQRIVSGEVEVGSERLRGGQLSAAEYETLHNRTARISGMPIYIDDTPAISVFELRAKARRLKAQHGVELIVIDYLQLMAGAKENRGNREQEISSISRALKGIAKELNIPVIALSQLNRSVETRGGDKRPMLSDLRESGAIEQDADIVGFVYRPEYYEITAYENGDTTAGIGELMISKHRNGRLSQIKLRYIADFAKFTNLEPTYSMPVNDRFESERNDNLDCKF
jgi:replicative DNA helicase